MFARIKHFVFLCTKFLFVFANITEKSEYILYGDLKKLFEVAHKFE